MRFFSFLILSLFLVGVLCPSLFAAGDSTADSSLVRWGVHYRGALDLRRSSPGFPWNETESCDSLSDRFAAMLRMGAHGLLDIYLKGAAGTLENLDGLSFRRFMLDESHAILNLPYDLKLGLFTRERVFTDDLLLLKLLSNQSSLDYRNAFGGQVVFNPSGTLYMRFIHASFKSFNGIQTHYGLPFFSMPSGTFNQLRVKFSTASRVRVGVSISELRSVSLMDNSVIAADLGVELFGAEFMMEFAKGFNEAISKIEISSEKGPEFKKMRIGELSPVFNDNEAFAVSVYGIEYRSRKVGVVGFEPSYRYSGRKFLDLFGEVIPGDVESYATIWWRHPRHAFIVDAVLRDRSFIDHSYSDRSVNAGAYLRFKNGIELRNRLVVSEGRKPSLVATVVSRDGHARLRMTGRFDDLGCTDRFSFFSEGWMNIGKTMELGCTLFLSPSGRAYYSLNFELRHGTSFLTTISYGSFMPNYSGISLERDYQVVEPSADRRLLVSTRFYLGSL